MHFFLDETIIACNLGLGTGVITTVGGDMLVDFDLVFILAGGPRGWWCATSDVCRVRVP